MSKSLMRGQLYDEIYHFDWGICLSGYNIMKKMKNNALTRFK